MNDPSHGERHRSARGGWLRAAVLGSNDAIVSTAGLLMGVSAADAPARTIAVVGLAGLVAGAMSMAVGEYVSVSSQRDAELADIALETRELAQSPQAELAELTAIYQQRGLDARLAAEVAAQLTAKGPLIAHLRDELNIEPQTRARPIQAALASAISFAMFSALPILALLAAPASSRMLVLAGFTVCLLAGLGAIGATMAGASLWRPVLRVTVGGACAMAVTVGIGRVIGVSLG